MYVWAGEWEGIYTVRVKLEFLTVPLSIVFSFKLGTKFIYFIPGTNFIAIFYRSNLTLHQTYYPEICKTFVIYKSCRIFESCEKLKSLIEALLRYTKK